MAIPFQAERTGNHAAPASAPPSPWGTPPWGGQQQPQQQQALPQAFQSSFNPGPVFTPQQTQQGVNQAMGHASRMANPDSIQKHMNTPGRSLDAGTLSLAMPQAARALAHGQAQAAAIPLFDEIANQNNELQGSMGQSNEWLGQGNLLARIQQDNNSNPMIAALLRGLA